jgi:ubiquinone/menaquinone biosynthesis C-methylase UbiE
MHEHKWHYQDENERRKWQDPESILNRIGLKVGQTLIDIGCGEGFFALPAARIVGPGGLIYASDISSEALDALQKKAEAEKLVNIRITSGAAEELVSCEKCADIVFLGMVLHDFKDPEAVLNKTAKMLKAGGKLVDLDWKKVATPIGPPTEIRFDQNYASQMIKKAGFRIERIEDNGLYHYIIMGVPFASGKN